MATRVGGGGTQPPKKKVRKVVGDSPSTRKADFAKAERAVQTKQHYWDRVAASGHHPKVQRARRKFVASGRDGLAEADLIDAREKQRRPSDKLALRHYRHYLGRTYNKLEDHLGPSQPKAKLTDRLDEGVAAAVYRGDQDSVRYRRGLVRDYMQRKYIHDPEKGRTRNIGQAFAETVPLHEWIHTRQDFDVPKRDLEGEAEVGGRYLAKQLGIPYTAAGGDYPAYEAYVRKHGGVGRVLKSISKRKR